MNAEIWLGLYCSPFASTHASPLPAFTTLKGTSDISLATIGSSKRTADQALTEYSVFIGLVTAWRLADWPTSRSPESVKRDHRRRRARAFGILDDLGVATLHDCDAGVGGAEIDANDFRHDSTLSFPSRPAQPKGAGSTPVNDVTCRKDRVRTGAI
jgi:hypothetical protein